VDNKIIDKFSEVCPTCGATIKSYHRWNKHSNGYWNESLEYECGCEFKFSPNFMYIELIRICPSDQNYQNKLRCRDAAIEKLRSVIKELDVDDEFLEQLYRQSFIVNGKQYRLDINTKSVI